MKILHAKYPKGTYKGQKSDGRYIDGYLYRNLELLADRIVDDMTFMGICYSSTLEVGTGKSVFCTQIGEAWTEIINKKHGLNLTFTEDNLAWRPEELIEKAFKLPKYSFILLDEWEDLSYWGQLGKSLRQFFRKCRQLNLFILVIIPNFFQMPMGYAISRSAFSIDVRFEEGFVRGYFYFYGFENKRKLYIKGRKEHNYKVASPNFHGRFLDGYGIPEKAYRAAKLKDMMEYDRDTPRLTEQQMVFHAEENLFGRLDPKMTKKYKILTKEWAFFCERDRKTIQNWRNRAHRGTVGEKEKERSTYKEYYKKKVDGDEDKLNNSSVVKNNDEKKDGPIDIPGDKKDE